MPAKGIHDEEPERDRRRADQPGNRSVGDENPAAGSLEQSTAGGFGAAIGAIAQ
jgi:hypothetical protein